MSDLKPCPFCGNEVEVEKIPLWYGNGHGYKDCYEFKIRCKKCGCRVDQPENDSVYRSEEKAKKNAIEAWNRRVNDANTNEIRKTLQDLIISNNKLRDVLSEQSKTMYEIDSALWAANITIQERENADGCVGCAYCDVKEWEMPCAKCKQNCKDYWRAKDD